jgi:CHAT domain-containing protein/Flp pilus assembly protein TadD
LAELPAGKDLQPGIETLASPNAQMADNYMGKGSRSLKNGAFGDAISDLEIALGLYQRISDTPKQCEVLLMLSQAGSMTGQYRRALQYLESALPLARGLDDKRQTALVLNGMGNAYIGLGKGEQAYDNLHQGLAIAKEYGYPDVMAAILNNLGNLHIFRTNYQKALENYRESAWQAEKAGNLSLSVIAVVNGAKVTFQTGNYTETLRELDKATDQLKKLDDSYTKAHSLINIGLSYSELRSRLPGQNKPISLQAYMTLNEALTVAQKINDQRTASYAYGYLGSLYEDEGRLPEALELTRMAVFTAQKKNASEALYKWHWQSGRILERLGHMDEAIKSYRQAIYDLQAIREEMSSCYANPEASYRRTASAVCFELVNLLLQRASKLREGEDNEPYLIEARDTLEILKVYELKEYFKDDCLDAARFVGKKMDEVSAKAVVIYPILFSDRLELLVSFMGHLKRFTIPVGSDTITGETREFRRKLEKRTTWEFLPHAQKIYDWLIRPLEKDLNEVKPDTLVFVPDGPLRTIPMAALHDGNQFLINRYAIAITPSLNLTDPGPLRREQAKVLALGLTESVQGFPGLPYVSDELKATKEFFGGEILLNKEFRVPNMEKELKKEPFSIVHIASHGHFGKDAAETFILTFDERFNMDQFGEFVGLFRFRDEPLDLLTLSACETAAGDDRAALGLAGVAVRAGALSAIATLWHVNDPASYELIVEFYRQLRAPHISRAAALRTAQLKMLDDLRYDHPGYWAPFLLINNWL